MANLPFIALEASHGKSLWTSVRSGGAAGAPVANGSASGSGMGCSSGWRQKLVLLGWVQKVIFMALLITQLHTPGGPKISWLENEGKIGICLWTMLVGCVGRRWEKSYERNKKNWKCAVGFALPVRKRPSQSQGHPPDFWGFQAAPQLRQPQCSVGQPQSGGVEERQERTFCRVYLPTFPHPKICPKSTGNVG